MLSDVKYGPKNHNIVMKPKRHDNTVVPFLNAFSVALNTQFMKGDYLNILF